MNGQTPSKEQVTAAGRQRILQGIEAKAQHEQRIADRVAQAERIPENLRPHMTLAQRLAESSNIREKTREAIAADPYAPPSPQVEPMQRAIDRMLGIHASERPLVFSL